MYTRKVVRLRSFAFVLALLLTAMPVLGVVCEMDCDQPPATSDCHRSGDSSDASTIAGGRHGCDHDHTIASPALLASSNARDSVGSFVPLSLATLAHTAVIHAHVAIPAMHGSPALSGRGTSFRFTILRI